MYLNKKRKRPSPPQETDFERKNRERNQALQLAQQFINIKPTKYLLK
jgi:hypothetical protein